MELLLFAVALPFWLAWCVLRGLRIHSRRPCTVRLDGERVEVTQGTRTISFVLADVQRARLAENDNWTESRLVDDALTLFGRWRALAKIPLSAAGLDVVRAELDRRGVPIDHVLVAAPAYLD